MARPVLHCTYLTYEVTADENQMPPETMAAAAALLCSSLGHTVGKQTFFTHVTPRRGLVRLVY